MSVIGPRPQLVRDMVFMTDEQRIRHTAKPGLSGLAQVNGRNAISWEDKIDWDLKYIEKVSLKEDLKIIFETVKKAFIKVSWGLLLVMCSSFLIYDTSQLNQKRNEKIRKTQINIFFKIVGTIHRRKINMSWYLKPVVSGTIKFP